MTTQLNNELRVFQIKYSYSSHVFCNVQDLNRVIHKLALRAGYFEIFYFENQRPKRATKKALDLFFEGAQLTRSFDYSKRW